MSDTGPRALMPSYPNLRCLGGIPAGRGARIKAGRFFRAPALLEFGEGETAVISSLDPFLIIDFRGADEAAQNHVAWHAPYEARRVHLPIEPSASPRIRALRDNGDMIRPDEATAIMVDAYRGFVNSHADTYARFLKAAADAGEAPILFHCTAGKDRTGLAAALILLALGASRESVMENYLATSALWKPHAQLLAGYPPSMHAAVFGVAEAYLDAALEELDRHHGGALQFARDAMGEAAHRDWTARHLEAA